MTYQQTPNIIYSKPYAYKIYLWPIVLGFLEWFGNTCMDKPNLLEKETKREESPLCIKK